MDDLQEALQRLKAEGYVPAHGPFQSGGWHVAFIPVVDGLWLDVFHRDPKPLRKARPRAGTSATGAHRTP